LVKYRKIINQRKKKMAKPKGEGLIQFIKFGVVGVANTGVDWVVFYILVNTFLAEGRTLAKAIAFLVAMLNSYIFNTIWTFKNEYQSATKKTDASKKSSIFGKFVVVSLVGWGVNVLVFNQTLSRIAFSLLGKEDLLPLVAASGAAIFWNFFANKFWTYRK
jgi:putative flippase GtrA